MTPDAYRKAYLAPLHPARPAGPLPHLPEAAWFIPQGGRATLQQLYAAGVQCGHGESAIELGNRICELPDLKSRTEPVEAELELARKAQADLQATTATLTADLDRSRTELKLAQALATERAAALDELSTGLSDRTAELDQARARIGELEGSTFWRLTKPLRYVAHRLKQAWRFLRRLPPRLVTARQILLTAGPVELARRVRAKWSALQASPVPVAMPASRVATGVGPLAFPASDDPLVSVIVPAYGEPLFTFSCLQSVAAQSGDHGLEAIVMDDCSPRALRDEMPQVRGVRFERNEANLGFLRNANRGAALARGRYLLFVNNDAQLAPDAVSALLRVFANRSDAGVVGAKLLFPDGKLQEAGGIVWSDASAWNDGRGQDPRRPEFNFLREADYVSGAALMIPRELFLSLGGFDERYLPAYCEDADLCFRVREAGRTVWYQPAAEAIHHEGISHGTDESVGIKRHQVLNRERFRERWTRTLSSHRANGVRVRLERTRKAKGRILLVEACIPTPDQDSGSVRCLRTMQVLQAMGYHVTLVADNLEYQPQWTPRLQQEGFEVLHHPYPDRIESHLAEHGCDYDAVILTRHYIAVKYLDTVRRHAPQALLIFDTVDLHFLRGQRLAELESSATLARGADEVRKQELACIRAADVTWVVSPVEQAVLAVEAPDAKVIVHTNIHDPSPSPTPWAEREGILFVGGYRHPPNIDAATFYAEQIVPYLRELLPGVTSYLAGSNAPASLTKLAGPGVEFLGFVPDIEAWLKRVRLSVSPLRYGAGVKGKVNQSMALGVPVVATSASVEGMYLEPDREVIVADEPRAFAEAVARVYQDPAIWNRLSEGGMANIGRHFSRQVARDALARTLACRESLRKG